MTWTYSEKYASFIPRLLATMIDSSIFNLVLPLFIWYLAQANTFSDVLTRAAYYIVLVLMPLSFIAIGYYVYCLSKYGQTLGKAVLGIKVTDAHNKLLSPKMAFFREVIAKPVSFALMGAGIFAILVNKDQRAWHDLLADTFSHRHAKRIGAGILVWILLLVLYGVFIGLAVSSFMANTSLQADFATLFPASH